jgi:hypothetical protein
MVAISFTDGGSRDARWRGTSFRFPYYSAYFSRPAIWLPGVNCALAYVNSVVYGCQARKR